MSVNTIEVLAKYGMDVGNDGKILQDDSIQIYQDGHLHDFGRGGIHYFNVDDFIEDRKDLHGASVQANTSLKISTPKYNVEGIYNSYKVQFEQLDDTFKTKALYDFIPEAFWSNGIPESIGYSFKENSLTVSVFDGDTIKATTVRRSYDVKWRTYGKKTFIPTRLTGKDDVYLASGMGEIVLMDLMRWDYMGLQADGMVKHLQGTPDQIKHLIILPDNDKSFLDKVDEIVCILAPKTASIVRWEYSDPRDAATAYGTPEALQTAIDENLETLEVPTPTATVPKVIPHHPLAESFEKRWVNPDLIGNVSSPKLLEAWSLNFNTFDQCIENNKSASKATKYVIPAITGSGKTQTMIHHARSLKGSDTSMLIVVSRTADADIACLEINENDEQNFCAVYHTNNILNPRVVLAGKDTLKNYQVLIVTHEMFRKRLKNGNTDDLLSTNQGSRDLIVIDEQINLLIEDQITLSQLNRLITVFESISSRKEYKKNVHLDKELQIITARRDQMKENLADESIGQFTPLRDQKVNYDDYITPELDKLEDELPATLFEKLAIMDEVVEMFELSVMLAILKDDPNIPFSAILTGRKDDVRDQSIRQQFIKTVESYTVSFLQWAYLYKNGSDISMNSASELIPDKSVVILDATSSENALYSLTKKYQGNLEIKPQVQCRSFKNLTIKVMKMNTGRAGILGGGGKELALQLSKEILYLSTEKDEVMTVVFKDFEPLLYTYLGENENIHITHWGNLTGSNEWRNCNTQFIFGSNHKHPSYKHNRHTISKGAKAAFDLKDEQNKREISIIERSDRIQETIQAMMRIRARNSVDIEGNCKTSTVYITISDNDYPSTMIALNRYLKDVVIEEWIPKELPEPTQSRSFTTAILMYLHNNLDIGDETKTAIVKHDLDIDQKVFRDLLSKKSFRKRLDETGFIMHYPPGQKNYRGISFRGLRYFKRMK